jgi:hypothetical protein
MSFAYLRLTGELTRPAYSVYAYRIVHKGNIYTYIGKTGDAAYISARSPIRRISGHFSFGSASTENQFIRSVAEKILGKNWVADYATPRPEIGEDRDAWELQRALFRHDVMREVSALQAVEWASIIVGDLERSAIEQQEHGPISNVNRCIEIQLIQRAASDSRLILLNSNLAGRPDPVEQDYQVKADALYRWILDGGDFALSTP